MLGFDFKNLTDDQQGILYVLGGSILLLLHQWFNWILIVIAIGMILYGVYKAHGIRNKIMRIFKHEKAALKKEYKEESEKK